MLMRHILRQIIQPVYQKGFHEPRASETSLEDLLKGMEAWDVGQLASMLRQQLENKIYLIVLDDVWSIAACEAIRFSLPDSNNGSRILVTTRIRAVAHTCCFHEYDRAYEIEPLTDHESRDLFFKRIFGSTVNCPDNLKEISEKILGKCGGAPLAIVSIAGLLVSKPVLSKDQWQKIYSSLGSELETSPSLERLKKILELSYNDLPYHLKTCFLYLSVYPEDHIIRRKSVLRRWVAERFVTEKRGLCVFEVAESYFDEFINRSIIHPEDMSFTGKVKTLRAHDVMLEIIVSSGDMKDIATSKMLSHVRSLSIFSGGETLQFGWMKLLRILDLEGYGILRNRDLKNVCSLFQLEYLSLRKTHIMELPAQIGNLQKLETLDIRETGVKHLPPGITYLPHLINLLGGRRFYNHNGLWPVSEFWGLHVPNKIGNLDALETLEQVEITEYASHSISELGKLSRLRKLGVMMFVDDDNSWASLMSALENISSSLCSLLLWRPDGTMNFNSLDSLSRPPLFMRSIDFREFPVLKLLVIHLAMFEAWRARFHEGALPRLEKLELSLFQQASIQEVSGIEFLPNLKEVSVSACPDNTMEDVIQSLKDDAKKNPSNPTVTFNTKKWVPMKARQIHL
ncbi:unnamed protein product [Miscanthus lutarioriparius]|uniref:NB-ARC domain-containing protein n=1 Tax=Miscanthus lutarioriparius TaxID=422564 RepID=A0A811NEA6_9POAL|nr:unnamed protein product [Miscanthus lutarioriparius]